MFVSELVTFKKSQSQVTQTNMWNSDLITVSPRSRDSRSGDETSKRRRVSTAKQVAESSQSGDETLSALPCLVTLNPGIRIMSVAAGGRHTLALSGISQ